MPAHRVGEARARRRAVSRVGERRCLRDERLCLQQADPVRGTSHLRTPLSQGLSLMEQLQGRLSGIALPKFIVDTPSGKGKVPLLPDYVHARSPGRTTLRTFRGELVDYIDPTEFIQ